MHNISIIVIVILLIFISSISTLKMSSSKGMSEKFDSSSSSKHPHFRANIRIGEWFGRRFWESRQFYASYIALFVAITNWITIQYKLLLENIPGLNLIFSNIWFFMIVAAIVFSVISILGGHYVHRKRQFRLEQAVAIEENPYLYKATPGKERNLMLPIVILQLESLEQLLLANNTLTEDKKKQFEMYRQTLVELMKGQSIGRT